ncbi:aminotransferase class I/II-fold pyridoxal phosphate-dependent enzyme [Gordonia sp. CPCC 206044]|uniref:pyridoxal phosphate-dependent aminotransferase n=1 Tax=Gordonia sp. CPCC 206044 TaxID=3140793 RepID=UPI003AF3BA6B
MSPPLLLGADPGPVEPLTRLDLNESAYGPLPAVAAVLRAGVDDTNRYPDFLPDRTRAHIARHMGVPDAQVTVGAGATGVALAALQACIRRATVRGTLHPAMVTALPTFDGYPILADMLGMRVDAVRLTADGSVDLDAMLGAVTSETVVVVICSPHNPTGSMVDEDDLHEFLWSLPPHVMVVFDEAYVEYTHDRPDLRWLFRVYDDILVLRTFSKAYGLAALRVGYGVGPPALVAAVRAFEVPFGVGSAAMAAVPVALSADHELSLRVRSMRAEREHMADELCSIGCPVLPSEGNFLFLPGADGVAIGGLLRGCGVAVKQCGRSGTRITIGDRFSTDHVMAAMRMTARIAV